MSALGVFSVTPEIELDVSRLPSKMRGKFTFQQISTDQVGKELPFDRSFSVKHDQMDELPNGYIKYFVTDIKRADFMLALRALFEESESAVREGKTYPEQSVTGFLGATHSKSLSKIQLANRVKHSCEGRCPPNCRQTGCKCNRGLSRCV
jgi:hypothetical protein